MKNDKINGGRWGAKEGDLYALAEREEIKRQEKKRRDSAKILTDQR